MNEVLIRCEGLTRRFGRTQAVDHLNLEIPKGSIYALVGPNGAGKTTLIKLLMNILQPGEGSASVLGMDSRSLGGKAFERIGYVSENQEMPEGMTVGRMMDYLRAFYPQWDRALEDQLIRQFNLPRDRKLKHLSRGMKMKAAFASSFAYRPELMILDEPFGGLDPLVRDELIESLLEHAQETTILLSSHDLSEIESFASHVGFLESGRLLFNEEMSTLSERFREVTVTLNQALPALAMLPKEWLQVEHRDHVLRFIHSGYRSGDSEQEIQKKIPGAGEIAVDPMPLRAIFLAVAKAQRTAHATTQAHNTTQQALEEVQA